VNAGDRAPDVAPDGSILVFDTATTVAVVGLGTSDGRLVAQTAWRAGYRHGQELLARIDGVLSEAGVGLHQLGGIVVGSGPGTFTGLRIGLATAKGLAHGLGIPLVGVPTGLALVNAAILVEPSAAPAAGLLPAGPSDRILIDPQGRASLLPAGVEPALEADWRLFAIDLPDRAPADALVRGEPIQRQLALSLLQLGAGRLGDSRPSDLATLVPEYVTLPRGVREETGAMAWSRDPS
jgi:tRNA threonylcarbamoyl adenosine modification protein YeaZ